MLAGIILILAGILIALFPLLLSWIVAILLIALGVVTLAAAYHERKLARHHDNPIVEIFLRF
jgi:uncharacterized membrane protein HdeD (DUF308 family)